MSIFHTFQISCIVNAVLAFLIGSFVFWKNRRKTVNITFFLLNIATFIWSLGIFLEIISSDKNTALLIGKAFHFAVFFIPIFYTHFILSIFDYHIRFKKFILIGYLLGILLSVLNFTDLLIRDVVAIPEFFINYYIKPGILYPFFLMIFGAFPLLGNFIIIRNYKRLSVLARNQYKYILVASLLGFVGGSSTYFLAFNIKIYPYPNFLVAIYPIIITYAIIKHRLLDINIVFKKGVTYAYASFLLLIPLFILVIYGQQATFKAVNYPFSVFILGVIVAAAYFFPRVKVRAEKTIEQFIFKNKYDYKKTISDLSKAMVSILSTNDLCKEIITTSTDALMVEKASIYILDEAKGFYELHESMGLTGEKVAANYHKEDPFFRWAEGHKEIFIREELERYTTDAEALAVAEKMNQMEAEISIPLITKKQLIGIINLGIKGRGEMYTHEDLELLATLSNQATTAIENARLYEDISRAKVQMQRADRLASLGTLTAGLAHEIRNPLVAIKTFTQLLPERFDDDEFRNHFLNVTAGEVDRISSLVNELLEFSRPSQPNLNREDLNQIVEKMLLLVATESHKKNLRIVKDFHQYLPPVVLDKEQIKQVFLNILLNAIDATPENGTITIETQPIEKNGSQEYVQIIVRDTGKGIPEEDLDKIFTPFYTTKHQGSGLGLAISHQIVQEHHGNIEVESEEYRGTTFYVTLSVNPLLTQEGKQGRH